MSVTFIVAMCLLGYCLALARFSRWPIEKTPILSVSIVVTILYLFTYMGQLRVGAYVVLMLGFFLLLLSPVYIEKNLETICTRYLTPGFIFWLLITGIFCIFAGLHWMKSWDEYAQWGPHAKILYLFRRFAVISDYGIHKDYPPAADLFYYIFVMFNNFFTSVLQVAQNIFFMAPIAIVVSYSKWSHFKSTISFLCLTLFFLVLAYNFHIGDNITLTVDHGIGLFFGGTLLAYYFSQRTSVDVIFLLPLIFCYSLLKPMVFPFVLLTTVIIFIDQMSKFIWRRSILLTSLIPMTSCIAILTWQYYVYQNHISSEMQFHLTITQLFQFMMGHLDVEQEIVIKGLLNHLNDVLFGLLPVLILVLITTFVLKNKTDERKRFLQWQLILLLGFVVYLFGLVLLYSFVLTQPAQIEWGFRRFLSIYFMGWSFLTLGVLYFFIDISWSRLKIHAQNACFLTSLVLFLSLNGVWGYQIINQPKNEAVLQGISNIARFVDKNTKPSDKILVDWRNLSLINQLDLKYQLMPRETASVMLTDFHNLTKQFDYVLLAAISNGFWQKHDKLFRDLFESPVPDVVYENCGIHNVNCNKNNETKDSAYLFKIIHTNPVRFKQIK